MKTYHNIAIAFCAVFFLVNVCAVDASEVLLFSHPNNGDVDTNVWMVSQETLKKSPKWKMGDGEPPLSLGKAIELAKNWVIARGCNTNSWVLEVKIRPVFPEFGEYQQICYYNIVFGGVGLFGHFRRCIILMDGTIVEPRWLAGTPKHAWDYRVYDE